MPAKSKISDHVIETWLPTGERHQRCRYCSFERVVTYFHSVSWAMHFLKACPNIPLEVKKEVVGLSNSQPVINLAQDPTIFFSNPKSGGQKKTGTNQQIGNPLTARQPEAARVDGEPIFPQVAIDNNEIQKCVVQQMLPNDGVLVTCIFCRASHVNNDFDASKWTMHIVNECHCVPPGIRRAVTRKFRKAARLAYKDDDSAEEPDSDAGGIEEGLAEVSSVQEAHLDLKPPAKRSRRKRVVSAPNSTTASASMSSSAPRVSNTKPTPANINMHLQTNNTEPCDEQRANEITFAIMKFVAGCALPIPIVESPFFVELLEKLHPKYASQYLPKASEFSNTWLPRLFATIEQQNVEMWAEERDMLHTLSADGFGSTHEGENDRNGPPVHTFTESALGKVQFVDCIDRVENDESSKYVADLFIERMEAASGSVGKDVEDHFSCVVMDDCGGKRKSVDLIQDRYPKVFGNECRIQCGLRLVEDISMIPDIERVLDAARQISKFVRSHPTVKDAYLRISSTEGGTMLKDFPASPLAHNTEFLGALLGPEERNRSCLTAMVNEAEWATQTTLGIPASDANKFVNIVQNDSFFSKVRCLRLLAEPLSMCISHLQCPGFRASWLVPLFEGLTKDISAWCNNASSQSHFDRVTLARIKDTVSKICFGDPPDRDGLFNDHLFIATMLDPAFSPDLDDLPDDWLTSCQAIFRRFYPADADFYAAESEIITLLDRQGKWGEQVRSQQGRFANIEGASNVSKLVAAQQTLYTFRPDLVWKVLLKRTFPKLYEIARRVLVMGTQASDVNRLCQPQSLFHCKLGRIQSNSLAYMLLSSHFNLRLHYKVLHDDINPSFFEALKDHLAVSSATIA